MIDITEQIKKQLEIQSPIALKYDQTAWFEYYQTEVIIKQQPQKVTFKVPVGLIVEEETNANLLTQYIVPVFKRTKFDGFCDFWKRTWFITKAIACALGYLIKMTFLGRL
jgi:hypothetical protein